MTLTHSRRGAESPTEAQTPVWTPDDLAVKTGGQWVAPPGASWNPRQVKSHVSKEQPNLDNINFLPGEASRSLQAEVRTGLPNAGGCLIIPERVYDATFAYPAPVLLVPNAQRAFGLLAKAGRDRFKGQVVAVSGTAGKTTTSGTITNMLSRFGTVASNYRGDNFILGVYELLASTPPEFDFQVVELGLGEHRNGLALLAAAARPHVAVLTQVGLAHLQILQTTDTNENSLLRLVLEQKLQIFGCLEGSRTAILNSDIPLFREAVEALVGKADTVLTFGRAESADFRLVDIRSSAERAELTAELKGHPLRCDLASSAEFLAINGLGALACVSALGLDPFVAAEELARRHALSRRVEVFRALIAGAEVTVLDDSFNANPTSIAASLDYLGALAARSGGRRLAVLGDVLELGEAAPQMHAAMAPMMVEKGVDRLFTFGPMMKFLQEAVPDEIKAGHFETKSALVDGVVAELAPGDVVAIKASGGLKFKEVVDLLRSRGKVT